MTDFFSIPKVSQLFSNSSGLERKPVAKIHYNFECKFAQRTQHMCCQISTTNRVFLTLHWARKEQKRDSNFYFQFLFSILFEVILQKKSSKFINFWAYILHNNFWSLCGIQNHSVWREQKSYIIHEKTSLAVEYEGL